MTKKSIKAINACVKRYRDLSTASNAELLSARFGVSTCDLCTLYYHSSDVSSCKRCPVLNHTGRQHCANTPWDGAGKRGLPSLNIWQVQSAAENGSAYALRHLRQRCRAEADFLESLLPDATTATKEK